MAKRTHQMSFLSGIKPGPYFIYEVCIYVLYKGRAEIRDSQYYKAEKPLQHSKTQYLRLSKDKMVAKIIDLIMAPEDYIKSHYKSEIK